MLDLSAAFDTVDHDILVNRLQSSFGLDGAVLKWLKSFIESRTQAVVFNGEKSTTSSLLCGVPQGSVLGPILFLLYTADVLLIAERHHINAHSYADDTQLYCSAEASCSETIISKMVACINDINTWMSANRLKLNTDKTQFIWLGTSPQLSKIEKQVVTLNNVAISMSSEVRCLGVVLDNELSFANHIKQLAKSCYYHLRQLWTVRRMLTTDASNTLIHAFILSRVDYCNSVYYRAHATHLQPLQSVLRAAARLVLKKRKYDQITASIRDVLHWLPLNKRVEFKLCMIVYKCLHNVAPTYLAESCARVSADAGRSRLRSAARGDLITPATRTKTFGPRAFNISGPTTWNGLPSVLHDESLTINQFCARLKTELFRRT